MSLSRREFLKLLGAAATVAAVPDIIGRRAVAAPAFMGEGPSLVFECASLEPGTYTFSMFVRGSIASYIGDDGLIRSVSDHGNGWKGLAIHGIEAKGGETAVRIPIGTGETGHKPVLAASGIVVRLSDGAFVDDFTKGPGGAQRTTRGEDKNLLIGRVSLERTATPYIPTAYQPPVETCRTNMLRNTGPMPRRRWSSS